MRNPGGWIQTFTGIAFWPVEPQIEEIDIIDIAHALAYQCRFAGHIKKFYSVAEHSWRASYLVPEQDALWALLHDASEAYLVDLPRPLKKYSEMGEAYQKIEKNLMLLICDRFGLGYQMPASVKVIDNVLLRTEQRDLLGPAPIPWDATDDGQPLDKFITPLAPEVAERFFLDRFHELYTNKLN